MGLGKDETELGGSWEFVDGRMVEDGTSSRIRLLVEEELRFVAVSSDGWEKLYLDPTDGRHWEHTYPQSEMHGGGPPTLRAIDAVIIHEKYGLPRGR